MPKSHHHKSLPVPEQAGSKYSAFPRNPHPYGSNISRNTGADSPVSHTRCSAHHTRCLPLHRRIGRSPYSGCRNRYSGESSIRAYNRSVHYRYRTDKMHRHSPAWHKCIATRHRTCCRHNRSSSVHYRCSSRYPSRSCIVKMKTEGFLSPDTNTRKDLQ